jgi:hypothetical protein
LEEYFNYNSWILIWQNCTVSLPKVYDKFLIILLLCINVFT